MTKKAKRKLYDMNFEKEGLHMALVSVDQGGPANGVNTLLMKSLGDIKEPLNETQLSSFKEIMKAMGSSEEEIENYLEAFCKNANGEDPVSETEDVEKASNKTSPKEEVTMTTDNVEMIEKSAFEAEIAKAVAAKEAEMAEIQKGLEAQLEEFNKAKEAEEKAKYLEKAKGYEVAGIEGEAVEGFAVALQKASKDDELKPLVEALNKMVELSKSLGEATEQGHGVDLADTKVSVSDLFKAKKKSN